MLARYVLFVNTCVYTMSIVLAELLSDVESSIAFHVVSPTWHEDIGGICSQVPGVVVVLCVMNVFASK